MPAPPSRRSAPPMPLSVSLPPRPLIVSAPLVPYNESAPLVPFTIAIVCSLFVHIAAGHGDSARPPDARSGGRNSLQHWGGRGTACLGSRLRCVMVHARHRV